MQNARQIEPKAKNSRNKYQTKCVIIRLRQIGLELASRAHTNLVKELHNYSYI